MSSRYLSSSIAKERLSNDSGVRLMSGACAVLPLYSSNVAVDRKPDDCLSGDNTFLNMSLDNSRFETGLAAQTMKSAKIMPLRFSRNCQTFKIRSPKRSTERRNNPPLTLPNCRLKDYDVQHHVELQSLVLILQDSRVT